MEPFATYREFAPCDALRADVYAFYSFVPGRASISPARPLLREIPFHGATLCAPQFADGHVSIVFELGQTCDADGRWRADSNALGGQVIGPMTGVGRTVGCDLPETVGVFFRPGRATPLVDLSIAELTDKTVTIADLWGADGSRLPGDLCELDEAARIDCLESILLTRLRRARHRLNALDVPGLARDVLRRQGRVRVDSLACAAGVSRQHLSREFRERIGIGPKLYGRLARFQAVLAYSGSRAKPDWAGVALDMGFADQSHMIADVRQFSGMTPQALADRDWFHPFIERAKWSQ
jgi:AraC-like DNA-binding protein